MMLRLVMVFEDVANIVFYAACLPVTFVLTCPALGAGLWVAPVT